MGAFYVMFYLGLYLLIAYVAYRLLESLVFTKIVALKWFLYVIMFVISVYTGSLPFVNYYNITPVVFIISVAVILIGVLAETGVDCFALSMSKSFVSWLLLRLVFGTVLSIVVYSFFA